MEKQPVELSPEIRAFLSTFEFAEFKPCAWYEKNLDWFIFMGQDVSYTALTTPSPYLEVFKDNASGKIVGFKVLGFSTLPRELRSHFVSMMDDDEIRNIEEIWLINMREMAPQMAAEEKEFFQELKARGGLDDEERAMLENLFARSSKGFVG